MQFDAPLHKLDKLPGNGQSQSRAAKLSRCDGVGLGKPIEGLGLRFGVHTDARVRDRDAKPLALAGLAAYQIELNLHMAGRRKFDGVADQVGNALPQTLFVADNGRVPLVQREGEQAYSRGACVDALQLRDLLNEPVDVEFLALQLNPAGFQAREVENVIDDRQQRFAAALHDFNVAVLLRIEPRAE